MLEDFQEQHPLDVWSLAEEDRSVYAELKTALEEQLAVTQRATPQMKNRKTAKKRKGSPRSAPK